MIFTYRICTGAGNCNQNNIKELLTMATKTVENKKEFTMEQAFALWKKQSKKGTTFFTGKGIVGFFNTNKKNPKEPDMRVYYTDEEGKAQKEPFVSMWCNVSKNGKKYLTGKLDGERLVGFINESGNEKRPYVSVYYSTDKEPVQAEQKEINTDTEPF